MIAPKHILGTFDEALASLRNNVLMMAGLNERSLERAMKGLFNRDDNLCANAIADDEEIDQLEIQIDRDGVAILLRFQPVASDLRRVVSAMKLSSNLERMADQATTVARRARKLNRHPHLDEVELMRPMYEHAMAMFKDSVDAFVREDVDLGRAVVLRDEKLDELNRVASDKLVARMAKDPDQLRGYLNLIFIGRCLERVGDHATNIAEDAVYAAAAEDIRHQIASETSDIGPDGLGPTETFNRIQKTVRQLVAEQYALWKNELLPELAKNGIYLREIAELPAKRAAWAHRYFQQEVFPMLTPLAVDASHPFPHLLNRSHNLLVRAKAQRSGEPLHAIVQVPRAVSRLIALPRGKGADEPWEYIYLASLIKQHIGELCPGLIIDDVHAFRVTRNSDLYIDEEEAENLLSTIDQDLQRSSRGNAVRLEVETDCPKDVLELLLRFFDLTEADAYKLDGPLSMTHLMPLVTNDAFAKLKDRPFQPARDPALPPHV